MDIRSWFSAQRFESLEPKQYRTAIIALVGVIIVMALTGLIAFSLTLKGEEQTLVPDVTGLELTSALIKMQEKDLYPRISMRISDTAEVRGTILEQDPPAGAIVKAGRRITLVISRGSVVDKVGDYVGQNLDELKIHLQTVFGAARQLIVVKDPVVYVYDKSPAGTIMEQSPGADTPITGIVQLSLVVSRGPEKAKVKVPGMIGLPIENVIEQLEKSGIAFKFSVRQAEGKEKPGTVVAQLPAAGTMENPMTPVSIVYTAQAPKEGMVNGLFSQALPVYPYPLKVSLFAEAPSGARTPLITVNHPGTLFTIPYTLPVDTVLVLQVLNRVVARVEAGK